MAAGVVFMNVHKLDLNEIRGFGRKKPLLCYIFLMGALGIGGIPLWNGYISKTLIHESIVEYIELLNEGRTAGFFDAAAMKGIEWTFLVSGGLTVAYMLKLYVALFVEKNKDSAVQEKFDGLYGQNQRRRADRKRNAAAGNGIFAESGYEPSGRFGIRVFAGKRKGLWYAVVVFPSKLKRRGDFHLYRNFDLSGYRKALAHG